MDENPYKSPKEIRAEKRLSRFQFTIRAIGIACDAILLLIFFMGLMLEIKVIVVLAGDGMLMGSRRSFYSVLLPSVVVGPAIIATCVTAVGGLLLAVRLWFDGLNRRASYLTAVVFAIAVVLILSRRA